MIIEKSTDQIYKAALTNSDLEKNLLLLVSSTRNPLNFEDYFGTLFRRWFT